MTEAAVVQNISCFGKFKLRVTKFFARARRGLHSALICGNTDATAENNEVGKSSLSFLSKESFKEELDQFIKEELKKASQMAIEEGPIENGSKKEGRSVASAEDMKESNDGEKEN